MKEGYTIIRGTETVNRRIVFIFFSSGRGQPKELKGNKFVPDGNASFISSFF